MEREPLVVNDALIESFSDESDPQQLARLAGALTANGVALIGLGRYEDAIAILDVLIDRFENDPAPELEGAVVVEALANKALALVEFGREDEARRVARDMGTRFGDQAAVVFEETSRRFAEAAKPQPHERLAIALYGKAGVLCQLDRTAEALATVSELITRFEDDPNPNIQVTVSDALEARELIMKDLFGRINDSFPAGDGDSGVA